MEKIFKIGVKMSTQLPVTKKEIENIIEKTIKRTMKEEFFKLRLELTSEVSDKEMKEIERKYIKPDRKIVYSEILKL